jgi:hypothetical protein
MGMLQDQRHRAKIEGIGPLVAHPDLAFDELPDFPRALILRQQLRIIRQLPDELRELWFILRDLSRLR